MFRIKKTLLSLFPFPQNKKTMLFLEANYHSVFNWLKFFFFVIYNIIIFLNSCVLLEMKKLTFFVFYNIKLYYVNYYTIYFITIIHYIFHKYFMKKKY